jgi:hypothetical protein
MGTPTLTVLPSAAKLRIGNKQGQIGVFFVDFPFDSNIVQGVVSGHATDEELRSPKFQAVCRALRKVGQYLFELYTVFSATLQGI